MSYAAFPGHRMAYDTDSQVKWYNWTSGFNSPALGFAVEPPAWLYDASFGQRLNGEATAMATYILAGFANRTHRTHMISFPEKYDIDGVCLSGKFYSNKWSASSSNYATGPWTAATFEDYANIREDLAFWMQEINPLSMSGVRSVWVYTSINTGAFGAEIWLNKMHLYGSPSAGETPDRLLFIDPSTGLEFTSSPLREIPRGTTIDQDILIKNNSLTLTAVDTVVSVGANAASFTDISSQMTIKETGGSFAGTLTITSIAPGATYPSGGDVITIRTPVPDTANLRVEAPRVKLSTESWA